MFIMFNKYQCQEGIVILISRLDQHASYKPNFITKVNKCITGINLQGKQSYNNIKTCDFLALTIILLIEHAT
jgi:hypothetical protein